jgi:hypothetical protein
LARVVLLDQILALGLFARGPSQEIVCANGRLRPLVA